MHLVRFLASWNQLAEKESYQINNLEQILVAKVFNFCGICSKRGILSFTFADRSKEWSQITSTIQLSSFTAHVAHAMPPNFLIPLVCHSNPSWAHSKTYEQKTVSLRPSVLSSSVPGMHGVHEPVTTCISYSPLLPRAQLGKP